MKTPACAVGLLSPHQPPRQVQGLSAAIQQLQTPTVRRRRVHGQPSTCPNLSQPVTPWHCARHCGAAAQLVLFIFTWSSRDGPAKCRCRFRPPPSKYEIWGFAPSGIIRFVTV
eukprot:1846396-Rhodomonas_salina.1